MPMPNSAVDADVIDVRVDFHVEAIEGPAGGVNRDIIPGALADEAGFVERDAVAVINIPDLGGERVGVRGKVRPSATLENAAIQFRAGLLLLGGLGRVSLEGLNFLK